MRTTALARMLPRHPAPQVKRGDLKRSSAHRINASCCAKLSSGTGVSPSAMGVRTNPACVLHRKSEAWCERRLLPLFLFVIGSFLGALIDTAYRSIAAGHFVHAGFLGALTGSVVLFMPVYGFGLVAVSLIRSLLRRQPLLLRALASGVSLALLEFAAGALLFFALGMRLWDYSGSPLNLLGFTDALHAAYWAVLALAADAGMGWAERRSAFPASVPFRPAEPPYRRY